MIHLRRMTFDNFKAFEKFDLTLRKSNVLVGPNNAGKSTVISALRMLQEVLKTARSKSSSLCAGNVYGWPISVSDLSISLENVHTELSDNDSSVRLVFDDESALKLMFPYQGAPFLLAEGYETRQIRPSDFRSQFPFSLHVVPVIGPVEHRETLVQEETVKRNLTSHRASRHFRSSWFHDPTDFDTFRERLKETWPGMDIAAPELIDDVVNMFCKENRFDREVFWSGFGFQVWCQILTHMIRGRDASLFVLDEADIYLHPDLQRALVGMLKEMPAASVIATHSSEIVAESAPDDIVVVNKRLRHAKRLKHVDDIQSTLGLLGSVHNVTLAQIAKAGHVLFVEGEDARLIRLLARKTGHSKLDASNGIAFVPIVGFSNWQKLIDFRSTLEKTFGDEIAKGIRWGLMLDRDYYCDEEIGEIRSSVSKDLGFCWIHSVKEIENYFLVPRAIAAAVNERLQSRKKVSGAKPVSAKEIEQLLLELSDPFQSHVRSQVAAKELEYRRKTGGNKENQATTIKRADEVVTAAWGTLSRRLKLVSGKELFKDLCREIQKRYKVSISINSVGSALTKGEANGAAGAMIDALMDFASQGPQGELEFH